MGKRRAIYQGPTPARRQADAAHRQRLQAKGITRIALPLPNELITTLDSIAAAQGFTGQTAQRRAQTVAWMIEKLGMLLDDMPNYSTPERL